jgi:hypothetical protein
MHVCDVYRGRICTIRSYSFEFPGVCTSHAAFWKLLTFYEECRILVVPLRADVSEKLIASISSLLLVTANVVPSSLILSSLMMEAIGRFLKQPHGMTFKKAEFFTVTTMKISNFTYCDVFDWRPSLLGNRSRNSSMDTLTTLVLLRYMVTNSRKASVSYCCCQY